jgi:hypothetical protein
MSDAKEKPFFVGYLGVPGKLRSFLVAVGGVLVIGFFAAGWVIGATQDDPGPGAFRFDFGRQTVTGTLELRPYPVLHVIEGTEHIAPGSALMLSGGGKRGAIDRAEPLAGQLVTASGVVLARGDLDMLQLRGGADGLSAAEGDAAPVEAEPLGRWRLAGEICDGKCLAGAMRPGTGLAHKACANLCLSGGVPPVFVSSQPVEGSAFLLIAGPDGGLLPEALYDAVGLYIGVEADIERRGDLLVMTIDPATVEKL